MSLTCVYGGHECDGCLNCEEEENIVDDYDPIYETWAEYDFDRYLDSL